jgi:hypothetical protein
MSGCPVLRQATIALCRDFAQPGSLGGGAAVRIFGELVRGGVRMICQESRRCLGVSWCRSSGVAEGSLGGVGDEIRLQLFVCGVYCKMHAQP